MLLSVAGPVRKKSSDHHLSTVRPVRLVVQLVGQRSFLSSDPVNNCTWYFEPDMGITMMQEPEIKRWTAKRKADLIRQTYRAKPPLRKPLLSMT